ncbi:hypothetical protein ACJ41O_001251 [Fusarium nematophilum]
MLFPRILTLAFATAIFPVAIALQLPDYRALKTSLHSSVLEVTFHNPDAPVVNLWSQDTQDELTDLVERLQNDNETKVVIFKSDVPRFFIAHLDLAILAGPNKLGVGLIPGGGGSQFLTNLIGRGRAMEYILAAKDITASEAEKIGWVNKAFETSADMYAYVDQLTSRLRLFPLTALHEAKKSINRISAPTFEDIYAEGVAFSKQIADPLTQQAMQRSAAVLGNMSLLEAELNLTDWAPAFYQ